jgi:glycosyltransferase involved in cell wall biosynthesis
VSALPTRDVAVYSPMRASYTRAAPASAAAPSFRRCSSAGGLPNGICARVAGKPEEARLRGSSRSCRSHGRRLVFAATTDLNFLPKRGVGVTKRLDYAVYRFGGRRADAIVAQTGEQERLARAMFPRAPRIVQIPSFAEPAEPSRAAPEAFLWTGRLDAIKNPDAYLALARAVSEARFWMIPKFAAEDPAHHEQVRATAAELPNLELLDSRPRGALMELVERSVAIVNSSPREGMPNLFLEGWARGIPALSLVRLIEELA